jgi:hypothetical protein
LQIAIDGGAGDAQQLRRFIVGAAQEIAQLHRADLPFVQRFELRQGLIEHQHLASRRVHPGDIRMQRNPHRLRSRTLHGVRAARIIAQDAAHHHRRKREKMPAVGDFRVALLGKAEVKLVHQASGLQRMRLAFAPQISLGDSAEVVIGHGGDVCERGAIALIPALEQRCDLTRNRVIGRHRREVFQDITARISSHQSQRSRPSGAGL